MITFWVLAAILIAMAIAFVALPLLAAPPTSVNLDVEEAVTRLRLAERLQKSGDQSEVQGIKLRTEISEQLMAQLDAIVARQNLPPLKGRWMGFLAVVLVPMLAVSLYLELGTPEAMQGSGPAPTVAGGTPQGEMPTDIPKAAEALKQRLAENPDDFEGWVLLARTYRSLERYAEASDAFASAVKLAPDNVAVIADLVETRIMMSDTGEISSNERAFLVHALTVNPDHPKSLWIAGMDAYQNGQWQAAHDYWSRLLPLVEGDEKIANMLRERLAEIESHLGEDAVEGGGQ